MHAVETVWSMATFQLLKKMIGVSCPTNLKVGNVTFIVIITLQHYNLWFDYQLKRLSVISILMTYL